MSRLRSILLLTICISCLPSAYQFIIKNKDNGHNFKNNDIKSEMVGNETSIFDNSRKDLIQMKTVDKITRPESINNNSSVKIRSYDEISEHEQRKSDTGLKSSRRRIKRGFNLLKGLKKFTKMKKSKNSKKKKSKKSKKKKKSKKSKKKKKSKKSKKKKESKKSKKGKKGKDSKKKKDKKKKEKSLQEKRNIEEIAEPEVEAEETEETEEMETESLPMNAFNAIKKKIKKATKKFAGFLS